MPQQEMNKVALLLLGAIGAAVLLADAWLLASRGEQATISATVHRLSQEYPAIPFAAGLLVAHLFRL